jgi:choloylglycine hydrolase
MCTNFRAKRSKDGSAVVGRSMEYPVGMPTGLGVLPKGHQGSAKAPAPADKRVEWTADYGVVGMAAFGDASSMSDGMNTAGVSAHLLYMPNGYCTYQAFVGDGNDISEMDLVAFVLGTCASVSDVKACLASLRVWGFDPGMGFAPPLHLLVHDRKSAIAVEFRPEGLSIVDNPTGVGTNAPWMDWMLVNLNNYVGIGATVPASVDAVGMHFASFGQGAGLRGLPGDYTGPSRFVRAATMVALSDQPATSRDAEMQVLHILNAFDIPGGLVREEANGQLVDEVTVWITISNLQDLRYSFRTVGDPTIYSVDLSSVDFTAPPRTLEMSWAGGFTPFPA